MSESNSKAVTISLKWRDPETGEEEIRQAQLPAVLGRHPDSDIYIEHPNLSRKHLSIMQDGFDVIVKDEKSGNGTVLNGDRIERGTLTNGDVLRLGTLEIEVNLPNLESLRRLQLAQNKTVVLDLDGPLVNEPPVKAKAPTPPPSPHVSNGETIPPLAPAGFQAAPPVENGGTIVWDEDEDDISGADQPAARVPIENRTIVFDPDDDSLKPLFNRQVEKAQFPPAWFNQELVNVHQIEASSYQVDEATYLAIGGGLGSFIWVDNLLIYGVPQEEIMSIGFEPKPYGRYRRLCSNSQIPDQERLRSNSDSTPDNIWGWPGYAPREIYRSFKNGNLKNAFRVGWQILAEPVYSDTYTPISGHVFDSIDREAERINWSQIWRRGSVRSIRKTDDGRYAVAYAQKDRQGNSTYKFALVNYIHLAVGYPGIRLLSNLQEYRRRTGDFKKIVNAYEVHDHIYKQLERKKGVIVIRGRGIVASRIIQRIFETRQVGGNVQVIHLMRSPKPEGNRNGFSQRVVDNHWEFQPFNWPKAAWSGLQRVEFESSPPGTRKQLLSGDAWGGTTTADREDWRQMVAGGLAEGWYEIRFGSIKRVDPNGDKLAITIESQHAETKLDADFVIDATGLESAIDAHPLLKDLLDQYGLKRNVQGRLEVTNDFEISGMRHQNGHMYAAGVITLGGPYAPVDSFLGLQYSAQRAVEHLIKKRAPGLKRLRGLRSVIQWTKWARGVKP